MSIIAEKGLNKPGRLNDELVSPKGWFSAEEELGKPLVTNSQEKLEETGRFIKEHLPMAARRAERLIDALKKKLSVEVPESYLRVRDDGVYHVLLLVSQTDYISPKIAAARVLADEIARRTRTYDICFTFSVQSERAINKDVHRTVYKLKHLQEHSNDQSRMDV